MEEGGGGVQLSVPLEITDAITEASQTCTVFVIWAGVLRGEPDVGAR